MTNLAQTTPFTAFVAKLLEESFPPDYFNTRKHITREQRSRLYGSYIFFLLYHEDFLKLFFLFIDITNSLSTSVTLSKKDFRSVLKIQIEKMKRKRNRRERRRPIVR